MHRVNVTSFRPDIIVALMSERHYLASQRIVECDVRLVIYEDGSWSVNAGDVCYDTVHGIACESGSLNVGDTNTEIEALADALIDGCEDQLAELSS